MIHRFNDHRAQGAGLRTPGRGRPIRPVVTARIGALKDKLSGLLRPASPTMQRAPALAPARAPVPVRPHREGQPW